MQVRKTAHSLDGQHQYVAGLPVEESVRMTEDRDKWKKSVCLNIEIYRRNTKSTA